jgi:hypothetical protein
MEHASDPEGMRDAVRDAHEALKDDAAPDARLLEAVASGLQSVPAGSPTAWFEVPTQRPPRQPNGFSNRRLV